MKKRIKRIAIISIIIIIVSLFCQFLFQAYSVYKTNGSRNISIDKKSFSVDEETDEEDDEKIDSKIITYKVHFGKIHANKMKIKYKTTVDQNVTINFDSFDEYGNHKPVTKYYGLLSTFNEATKYVGEDISTIEIKISVDTDENFELIGLEINNNIHFNIYLFILILIIVSLGTIITYFRKTIFKKLELLFVLFAISFGICQIICIPEITCLSWDDQIHYQSVYTQFDFNKVSYTDSYLFSINVRKKAIGIPNTIEEKNQITNYLNKNNFSHKENIFEKNYNNISYSDYTYIPMSLSVKICKLLSVPYSYQFLIGKLINLLLYTLIMYYTIKKAKIGKGLLFVLALMPTTIFLAAQYSRDAVITASVYLVTSTFMNIYFKKDKADKKNIMIICLFSIIASLSKAIYIPTILLLLLLPTKLFKDKKQAIIIKIIVSCICIVMLSTFVIPTISEPLVIGDLRGGDTSVSRQLSLILSQPISFMKMVIKYFSDNIVNLFLSKELFANFNRVWIANDAIYYSYLILLLYLLFGQNKKRKTNIEEKTNKKYCIAILSIVFIITCMICGSMYLSFTPVAGTTISGVQPRYFIPLLFPLLSCFIQKNDDNDDKKNIIYSLVMIILFIYINYYFYATFCI